MSRYFTYIDDLVNGMRLLIEAIPRTPSSTKNNFDVVDSKSHVAPFKVVNISNSKPAKLLDFVNAIKSAVGLKAVKNSMPMRLMRSTFMHNRD